MMPRKEVMRLIDFKTSSRPRALKDPPIGGWFNICDASEQSGYSTAYLYMLAQRGLVQSTLDGNGRVVILDQSLDKYMREHRLAGRPPRSLAR